VELDRGASSAGGVTRPRDGTQGEKGPSPGTVPSLTGSRVGRGAGQSRLAKLEAEFARFRDRLVRLEGGFVAADPPYDARHGAFLAPCRLATPDGRASQAPVWPTTPRSGLARAGPPHDARFLGCASCATPRDAHEGCSPWACLRSNRLTTTRRGSATEKSPGRARTRAHLPGLEKACEGGKSMIQ